MTAFITEAQAATLRAIRGIKNDDLQGYKDAKNSTFAAIKDSLGVPASTHCKVEIDDRNSPDYRKLKGRRDDGTWGYIDEDSGDIAPSTHHPDDSFYHQRVAETQLTFGADDRGADDSQPAPTGQDYTAAPSCDPTRTFLGALTLTSSDDSLETFDQTLLNVTEVLLRVTDALMLRIEA